MFSFLKIKKEKLPELSALRPPLFNSDSFWFSALGVCLLILIVTAFIGGQIFYSQYFETYKKTGSSENFSNLINIKELQDAIKARDEFKIQEVELPSDPSL